MREYYDMYLCSDMLLLPNVFRPSMTCQKQYGLQPIDYLEINAEIDLGTRVGL